MKFQSDRAFAPQHPLFGFMFAQRHLQICEDAQIRLTEDDDKPDLDLAECYRVPLVIDLDTVSRVYVSKLANDNISLLQEVSA